MSARRRRRTAPSTAEGAEPSPAPVRHVHGPVAALLDPPVTRYSTRTPEAQTSAEHPEEDHR